MKIEIGNNEIFFYIDKSLYNADVIYKCFYWYSTDYTIDITDDSQDFYLVKLEISNKDYIDSLIAKIKKDLVGFKLRDIVTKEPQSIRELLIAKAFAYYDSEEDPNTEISDPVGFDPASI